MPVLQVLAFLSPIEMNFRTNRTGVGVSVLPPLAVSVAKPQHPQIGERAHRSEHTCGDLSCSGIEFNSCRGGCPNKSSIQSPQLAIRKQRGSQKVRIDPTDAEARELPEFNQLHNLLMSSRSGGRERLKIAQNARSILQIAARQFTRDEWVDHNQGLVE